MSGMAGNHEAVSVLAPLLRSNGEPYPQTLFEADSSFRSVPIATSSDIALGKPQPVWVLRLGQSQRKRKT